MFDYFRVGACVPKLQVCDCKTNTDEIINKIIEAEKLGVKLLTFPELCITGYTCGDMFLQSKLLSGVKSALTYLVDVTRDINMVIFIGAPIKIGYQLFNAALMFYKGVIRGIQLKSYLPNYAEYYEKRWFSSARDLDFTEISSLDVLEREGTDVYSIPVGNDLTYCINGIKFAAEICEDLWAPITPSAHYALAGADIICNLSASNDVIGKREFRRRLVLDKSATGCLSYLYASAGAGESTSDLYFSGHSIIASNGRLIKESEPEMDDDYLLVCDLDLEKNRADRLKCKTFKDAYMNSGNARLLREIRIETKLDLTSDGSMLQIKKHPFIPSDPQKRFSRCKEIFAIQVGGLKKRLSVTGSKMVVGFSGGMDSTLTLLVCASALKKLGLPMTELHGITMPAFGTSDRTYTNSLKLMETLGITVKTIDIKESCTRHLADIGHNGSSKDVTYENAQARERTQVLMDYANMIGGIVVGTGDLSELALGWCTYNGDQMSMYGVNASIPKTLVRYMIESVADAGIFPESSETLRDIVNTPISPELLPPDEHGNITQKTEDAVGPYELHDFYLYYMMRYGFSPEKIFNMAMNAFAGDYKPEELLKWMKLFYKRFFSQQFKRSCMPDGVKVGSVALSPRGDLRMPSDASAALWMEELEMLEVEL